MSDPGLEAEPARVADLQIERYLLNELAPAETARLSRLLETDAALGSSVAALRQADDAWRRSEDARRLADDIRSRQRAGSPRRRAAGVSVLRWAIPLGAAAALAVWAVAPTAITTPPGSPGTAAEGDRIKGLGASLAIYRRTESGSEQLDDGAVAREGDMVRIGYRVTRNGYGTILSVDGRGQVTVHLPTSSGRSTALETGGQVLLDRAFELDDAPEAERFHFIAGPAPFDVAPLIDAVRSAGAAGAAVPGLDPALDHFTFVLRKDARP